MHNKEVARKEGVWNTCSHLCSMFYQYLFTVSTKRLGVPNVKYDVRNVSTQITLLLNYKAPMKIVRGVDTER